MYEVLSNKNHSVFAIHSFGARERYPLNHQIFFRRFQIMCDSKELSSYHLSNTSHESREVRFRFFYFQK